MKRNSSIANDARYANSLCVSVLRRSMVFQTGRSSQISTQVRLTSCVVIESQFQLCKEVIVGSIRWEHSQTVPVARSCSALSKRGCYSHVNWVRATRDLFFKQWGFSFILKNQFFSRIIYQSFCLFLEMVLEIAFEKIQKYLFIFNLFLI